MLNLNTIPIPRNSGSSLGTNEHENFPTVGLKSILQNSDLLDLLLKPIAYTKSGEEVIKSNNNNNPHNGIMGGNYAPELSGLNLEELLEGPTSKPPVVVNDHDYFVYNESKVFDDKQDKSYGNAFLGPSLWDKNEIFQSDQFGVEYLGIDEFLSDSNLNEADIEFLDGLKSGEPFGGSDSQSGSPPVTEFKKFTDTTPMFNGHKDERKVAAANKPFTSSSVKMSMSTLLKEWDEDRKNEDDDNSDSDDLHPAKKRLFNDRLVLQPALKKSKKQFVPNEMKDEKYWARRNKNNVAAKRSRETRRLKENEIVIAATYLEHENDQLQKQLEDYKDKCADLEKRLSHYEQI